MIYRLDNAGAWRTYTGGMNLGKLRGEENPELSHYPEEWIMSITEANGKIPGEGLSHIVQTGMTLRDLIASDPEKFLGQTHASRYGANTGVLTKLIDSAERLTIQVHPTKKEAEKFFSSPFGKTECWYVLGGNDPYVYAGFRKGVTEEQWRELFEKQDIEGMLSCLIRFSVKPGDTILIEGGLPHAIGKDTFLVEIQEPTDYTFRAERITPLGLKIDDSLCHLGLGFDRMLSCFRYEGWTEEEAKERIFLHSELRKESGDGRVTKLVDHRDTSCFAMDMIEVEPGKTLEYESASFGALFILAGNGLVENEEFAPDTQFFVPYGTGKLDIMNRGTDVVRAFFCTGPDITRK